MGLLELPEDQVLEFLLALACIPDILFIILTKLLQMVI